MFTSVTAFGREGGNLSTIVQTRPAVTLTQSRVTPTHNNTATKTDTKNTSSRGGTDVSGGASRIASANTTQTTNIVNRENDTRNVAKRVIVTSPTNVVSRSVTVQKVTESGTTSSGSSSSVSVSNGTRKVTSETVAAIKENMESLSSLRETCKQQYYQCMDGFCNVLDENLGRCSCNKNISGYSKTEEALRDANSELQEVAQKIQYIGLTPREIKTLFTQTVAEDALQANTDNSKLKNDLSRIRNMLVDVKSGSASSSVTSDSGISLDLSNLLSFNIDSTGFDITSLFSTGSQNNTQSIANQRGEALYKSGAARCKAAVLNKCQAQGIDVAVIVNGYDVEIDKDCMSYQRKLEDENAAMLATIRNAKTVLQKARLTVAQQKNQYDLRGCISALDSCMQDDFVCGSDYVDCVDPSGRYIVNGAVVEGSMPGVLGGSWGEDGTDAYAESGLYTAWNYDEQNIYAKNPETAYTIPLYIKDTMNLKSAQNSAATDISTWLLSKMGYHDDASGKNYGMCVSVLNRCQKYTYDKDGKYMAANLVISNWLERAFPRIKKAQDDILTKYAQSCLGEVTQCLSQNNFYYTSNNTTSNDNPSNMAIRACLPLINTCRSVTLGLTTATVDTDDLENIYAWLDAGIGTSFANECIESGGKWSGNDGCSCSESDNFVDNVPGKSCKCKGGFVSSVNNGTVTCVVASEDVQECIDNDRTEWDGTQCKCKAPYPKKLNGECLTNAEYTCKDSGGTIDVEDRCICSSGNISVNYQRCKNIETSFTSTEECEVKNAANGENEQGTERYCGEQSSLNDEAWDAGSTSTGEGYSGLGACFDNTDQNVAFTSRSDIGDSGDVCWCYVGMHGTRGYSERDRWMWVFAKDVAASGYPNYCTLFCPTICAKAMKQGTDVAKKMVTQKP
ncbi:MAG: hypothetical protein IKP05_00880 [Alphaproteobacteria bacterium]|nr:hypothetical protein [Alphaproteobacteria bacterium]